MRRDDPAPDQGRALLETAGKTVLVVRLVALLLALVSSVGDGPALVVGGVLVLVAVNGRPAALRATGALLIGMVMPRAGAVLLVALLAGGQLLVGLGPVGGQAAVTLVANLAGCATACGEQVRELLGGLRSGPAGSAPPDLDHLVRAWSDRTGVEVRAVLDHESRGDAPGPAALAVAAAVLGEALDDVERHAGASAVDVRLDAATGDGEVLTMTVHDDGSGFDARTAAPGRWGVVGMRERATEAGGTLAVTSSPGRGTTVILRAPLARADAPVVARTAAGAPAHPSGSWRERAARGGGRRQRLRVRRAGEPAGHRARREGRRPGR